MTDLPDAALLHKTRSAVLNVLIVAGVGIAASGWLLRWRDRWALFRAPGGVGQGLMFALVVVAVSSYVVRRAYSGGGSGLEPSRRSSRFYRGHVLAAAIGALAVPLGLAYGWFVRPRLDAVAPFWVAALTLGFLSLPHAHELDGLGLDLPSEADGRAPRASKTSP